jgi:hypothetical protein
VGNQQYIFPAFRLEAGASVQVTSGTNAMDNPPSQLKWTVAYIWNNAGDSAELYDAADKLVFTYPILGGMDKLERGSHRGRTNSNPSTLSRQVIICPRSPFPYINRVV